MLRGHGLSRLRNAARHEYATIIVIIERTSTTRKCHVQVSKFRDEESQLLN